MTKKQIKTTKEINEFFAENRKGYSAFPTDEDEIGIEVTWGDWKHDHLYVKNIIKEKFGLQYAGQEVIEEDGSDTYSSIHYFKITK